MRCDHGYDRAMSGAGHVPLHVLAEVGVVDRHPAGVDDVDEHQRVVVREMDVDIVRRVVGAAPGQLDALSPDLERVSIGEGHIRHRPGRVVVPDKKPAGLLVPDPDDILEQERGRAVVGVVMGVDQVRHGVADALSGGDLIDGPPQVMADLRRRVEQHHAVPCNQER